MKEKFQKYTVRCQDIGIEICSDMKSKKYKEIREISSGKYLTICTIVSVLENRQLCVICKLKMYVVNGTGFELTIERGSFSASVTFAAVRE